ncbi:hypothetical protein [Microbulbifer sp. 2205BS26-8]|uniref:hypothetical protein n=1 Tax=Microbulbifer sp. 2205BS26-8 TaxID=3064386 RepID=UPI0027402917|nr:hypothetical protein [Microbulbifer sp. 2205BS26-8]MDP5210975.1 hypothetical protein [Microbulbifer sp. 2205BS26-8]
MELTLSINQARSIEWELNLQQATLFSFILNAAHWADKQGDYWYLSKGKIVNELPILSDKRDTIYRLGTQLIRKDLIERKVINGGDHYRVTEKGLQWNKAEVGKKSEAPRKNIRRSEKNPSNLGKISEPLRKNIRGSEKNPSELGKKSESPRKNIRATSEKNPTYQYTNLSVNQDQNTNTGDLSSEPPPDQPDPIEQEFAQLWEIYPKRAGGNPKVGALRAYRTLRKQFPFEPIRAGLVRYASYCEATGDAGTRYVKQAKTFFGPDLHWQDEYPLPKQGKPHENRNSGPGNRLQQEHAEINAAFARASAREAAAGPVEAHESAVRPQVVVPTCPV